MSWIKRQYSTPFWGVVLFSGFLARIDPLANIPYWYDFALTFLLIYALITGYVIARIIIQTQSKS